MYYIPYKSRQCYKKCVTNPLQNPYITPQIPYILTNFELLHVVQLPIPLEGQVML
jgi:hypothetical protein